MGGGDPFMPFRLLSREINLATSAFFNLDEFPSRASARSHREDGARGLPLWDRAKLGKGATRSSRPTAPPPARAGARNLRSGMSAQWLQGDGKDVEAKEKAGCAVPGLGLHETAPSRRVQTPKAIAIDGSIDIIKINKY